jgi:hypothetical protein
MRGGRRNRSRKTVAKEEPIVRVAPTRRSRAKVRRPSPPVTPKIPESVQKRIEEMIASGRMKAPAPKKPAPKKTVAKKKPVPPKATRPKPVARRKPAVQPVRKKPTAKKPVARKRPVTRIGELGRESYSGMPDISESVQKRIEEMMASGRMKAPTTPRKTTPRKTTPKKTAAPKETAAKKKPQTTTGSFGGTGIVMSESARKEQEAIKNSPLYSEVQSANRALNKYVKEKHGNSENSAQSDPVYQKMVKDLFALQDRAAGAFSSQSTAPQAPTPPATQQQTGGGSFESDYIDWLESRPTAPRRPKGMGAASKSYQAKRKKYESDKAKWDASKPSRATYTAPAPASSPTAPTAPVVQPDYVPPPSGEAPDKFAGRYVPPTSILGTPDMSISSNIVGQSFDPSFAASFTPPPQPSGSTFGGYGQQAPMQALAPYAGMAQANPQPTDFFPTYIPRPEPIYETVQRPQVNNPPPTAPQRPVMGRGLSDDDVFERPYSLR